MAIKLNSSTLVGEFQYILSSDPALDTKAKDFAEKYRIFLENGTMPPIKENMDPTIWTLRPIADNDLITKLKGDCRRYNVDYYALQIARYSLRSVANLTDPETNEEFVVEHGRGPYGFDHISPENDKAIPQAILVALGLATLAHSDFS